MLKWMKLFAAIEELHNDIVGFHWNTYLRCDYCYCGCTLHVPDYDPDDEEEYEEYLRALELVGPCDRCEEYDRYDSPVVFDWQEDKYESIRLDREVYCDFSVGVRMPKIVLNDDGCRERTGEWFTVYDLHSIKLTYDGEVVSTYHGQSLIPILDLIDYEMSRLESEFENPTYPRDGTVWDSIGKAIAREPIKRKYYMLVDARASLIDKFKDIVPDKYKLKEVS